MARFQALTSPTVTPGRVGVGPSYPQTRKPAATSRAWTSPSMATSCSSCQLRAFHMRQWPSFVPVKTRTPPLSSLWLQTAVTAFEAEPPLPLWPVFFATNTSATRCKEWANWQPPLLWPLWHCCAPPSRKNLHNLASGCSWPPVFCCCCWFRFLLPPKLLLLLLPPPKRLLLPPPRRRDAMFPDCGAGCVWERRVFVVRCASRALCGSRHSAPAGGASCCSAVASRVPLQTSSCRRG